MAALRTALGGLVPLVVLASGCGGDAEPAADQHQHAWSYADVAAWEGECAEGSAQSPVDLAEAAPGDGAEVELDYRASAASVVDNGHAVQTTIEDGGTLTVDGETYELRQFHTHTPGEHTVDGSPYAAELHLVHEAADGALAVLGVLVAQGAEHPVIAEVLAQAPEAGADPVPTAEGIDAATLLPDGRGTYRYAGSLTTPPCSEGVSWLVLDEPVTWSPEQVAELAARHPDSHRPAQPLNDRVLLHVER